MTTTSYSIPPWRTVENTRTTIHRCPETNDASLSHVAAVHVYIYIFVCVHVWSSGLFVSCVPAGRHRKITTFFLTFFLTYMLNDNVPSLIQGCERVWWGVLLRPFRIVCAVVARQMQRGAGREAGCENRGCRGWRRRLHGNNGGRYIYTVNPPYIPTVLLKCLCVSLRVLCAQKHA